jgi:hypothetical protein
MRLLSSTSKAMAIIHLTNPDGSLYAIINVPNVYQYKLFIFEVHPYLGPIKLKSDCNPASRMGRKFFKAFAEWDKLTPEEKSKTQINK